MSFSAAAEETRPTDASGRTNMVTGYALIALSILLFVGSWMAAGVTTGGSYFVAIGPFVHGLVRLSRASQQKPRSKPRAGTPYR